MESFVWEVLLGVYVGGGGLSGGFLSWNQFLQEPSKRNMTVGFPMRSQLQLRNDKYIVMQYSNWINSTLSQKQLMSCLAQWLKHSVYNRGVASSSPNIGILTVNFSHGTRSFYVQWNHCTSRMRSQPQWRNNKYM